MRDAVDLLSQLRVAVKLLFQRAHAMSQAGFVTPEESRALRNRYSEPFPTEICGYESQSRNVATPAPCG
jgi:hypothetical protein